MAVPANPDPLSKSVAETAARVGPAVVQIRSLRYRSSYFLGSPFGGFEGVASGMVMDRQGHILTNAHVLEGASEVAVTFPSRRQTEARLVGYDLPSDLAVLKVDGHLVSSTVVFGDAENLKPGTLVIAVGNPYGFDWTVSFGVVSAVQRSIVTPSGTVLEGLIQTDAAINPGNSGGPLATLDGKVVGVTTAMIAGGQGIAFAIPANTAYRLGRRLIEKGTVTQSWLGIAGHTETIDPQVARLLDFPANSGVLVLEVTARGPAERAGVRPFDLIVALNGKQISGMAALRGELAEIPPGEPVTLTIFRGSKLMKLHLRAGVLPANRR